MFVHPHVHSDYSNYGMLDSINRIENIVKQVKSLGQSSWCLTDHNTCSGIVDAYKQSKKAGLHFIPGAELYLTYDLAIQQRDLSHITFWAKTNEGLENLYKMTSEAHGDKGCSPNNYYYKSRVDIGLIRKYAKGLMVGTACLGGFLRRNDGSINEEPLTQLIDIFGKDDVFIELHTYQCEEQYEYNRKLIELSKKYDVKLIAATDAHFTLKNDAEYRRLFKNTSKEQDNSEHVDDTLYLQSEDEIRENLKYLPSNIVEESLSNTQLIADKSNVTIEFGKKYYPEYPCDDPIEELKKQCRIGWKTKGIGKYPNAQEYVDRLNKVELPVIKAQGYAPYFLITSDLYKFGREQGYPQSPGRGSAVASLILWLIGVTQLDPLKYNCIFERFAHMSRISPPDVDNDISRKHRGEYIKHVQDTYGEVYPCRTFSTVGAGKAIGIAGKALGYDAQSIIALSKSLSKYESDDEDDDTSSYDKKIWMLDNIKTEENTELIELAKHFVGIIFGYSKHASALIVLNEDITKFCSIERQIDSKTHEVNYVAACNFKYLEEMGLMKLDMLGLKTLDVIQDTINSLLEPIDIMNIPVDDEETSEMLIEGHTKGCFQISSPGMTQLVKQIKPKEFKDLIPLVALYRPGPLGAIVEETGDTMVQTYVKVKDGDIEPTYLHPKLEPILQDTYSIILYQEQILEIAKQLCGYSLGEADMLRRIIGKKKVDEMKPALETMIQRGVDNGIPKDVMQKIAHQIVEFASYCFNKCLSGDERLHRPANGKFAPTLSEMWLIKNDVEYAKATGHKDLHDKYCRYGYGHGLSMFSDGKIKKNTVVDIVPSGVADIYRMTTKTGKMVDCTLNHKIPTPNGESILGDLSIGDEVYVLGNYEITAKIYNFYNGGSFESNVPKKGQMGFQRNPYGCSVMFDTVREFFSNMHAPCEDCGSSDAKKYELHHINMDRSDNSNENLKWLCLSCHRKAHYAMGRNKVGTRGSSAVIDTIVSIEYLKTDTVFDVTMEAPNHNFVNMGGVVVCNSHSAGYGKLTYQTAYLKAHYPLQFMCSCINNEHGVQEKILPFINECKRMNIPVLPPDLSKGNRQWVIEGDSIRIGLEFIKGIGKNLHTTPCDSFLSVISANPKGVTEALIKAGALDFFGHTRALMLSNLTTLQDMLKREQQCSAKITENTKALSLATTEKERKKFQRQLKSWQEKLQECKDTVAQKETGEFDEIAAEVEVLGFSFKEIPKVKLGKLVKIYKKNDKNGNGMAFLTMDTNYGEFRCTVFTKGWTKIATKVKQGESYEFVVSDSGILTEIRIDGTVVKTNERRKF